MESASSITKYDKSEKNKRSKKKRSRNHSLVRTKTGTRIPEVSKKAGYRTAAYKTPHRCLFSPRAGPRVWVLPYHPFSGHGCLLDFQKLLIPLKITVKIKNYEYSRSFFKSRSVNNSAHSERDR